MQRAPAGIRLLLAVALTASASSEGSSAPSSLKTLATYLTSARALPLGSRPAPPDVDLKALTGLHTAAIRNALGPPDKREPYYPPLECHAAQCWSFTYGPGPALTPDPTDNHDGTMTAYVTTGGPWLLVLGFNNDRLNTAFWQGQK